MCIRDRSHVAHVDTGDVGRAGGVDVRGVPRVLHAARPLGCLLYTSRAMCEKLLARNLNEQDDARLLDDLLEKAGAENGK